MDCALNRSILKAARGSLAFETSFFSVVWQNPRHWTMVSRHETRIT